MTLTPLLRVVFWVVKSVGPTESLRQLTQPVACFGQHLSAAGNGEGGDGSQLPGLSLGILRSRYGYLCVLRSTDSDFQF